MRPTPAFGLEKPVRGSLSPGNAGPHGPIHPYTIIVLVAGDKNV